MRFTSSCHPQPCMCLLALRSAGCFCESCSASFILPILLVIMLARSRKAAVRIHYKCPTVTMGLPQLGDHEAVLLKSSCSAYSLSLGQVLASSPATAY